MRGEFGGDEVGEMAYGVELLEFGGLELDLESGLDGDDEVDVVEGVPLWDLGRGEVRCEDEGVVVEEIVEDGSELGVDFFGGHG